MMRSVPGINTSEIPQPALTVGLVTDLHYAPITVGTRHCSESLTKLQACVRSFQSRALDVIVCLGDVIDQSETVAGELDCIREVTDCLASLPVRSHYVLGNHDVSELRKEQFLAACGQDASYYSFDCRGVHIVVLDSNFNSDGTPFAPGNFCWNDAWIGDEQIRWLEKDLATTADVPVLVFCHANLDHRVRPDGNLNGHVIRDAAAVREVLEASGTVRAVIQGHDHGGHLAINNGIPYITLKAVVEGSGPDQNAYAVLSLHEDDTVEIEGFGKQPSMRFEPQD